MPDLNTRYRRGARLLVRAIGSRIEVLDGQPTKSPAIWCLLDQRPGHRNQVLGLAEALRDRTNAEIHLIEVRGVSHGILTGLASRGHLPAGDPSLLIGAGHSTHMPLTELGWRTRAKTVVLMKPTFPFQWFDLCLLPGVYALRKKPANVVLTTGVLNRIRPSSRHDRRQGLFLVGGPCDHHRWADDQVIQQIAAIVKQDQDVSWTVATSRRTPRSFVRSLRQTLPAIGIHEPDDVGTDWLPDRLSQCGKVWVSADSVSMMYEAVTSGATTGVLELERARANRATKSIDLLLDSDAVTSFGHWHETRVMKPASIQISEAERCAEEIARRFFRNSNSTGQQRRAA